jgi:hypothetical protein
VPGEIVTLLPSGNVIVPPERAEMGCDTEAIVPATMTETDAAFVESAALVAEMFSVKGVGTVVGAV